MLTRVANFIREWPAKKKAIVPLASLVVYVVSTYFGADSQTTAEVILILTSLGVYRVANVRSPQ